MIPNIITLIATFAIIYELFIAPLFQQDEEDYECSVKNLIMGFVLIIITNIFELCI